MLCDIKKIYTNSYEASDKELDLRKQLVFKCGIEAEMMVDTLNMTFPRM
jgi:hypothetical protein